jgi:cytochrome bd-type quinol oxidase subunit 2
VSDQLSDQVPQQRATNLGFGRILIVVYALFAIAATSRSIVQISSVFSEAPFAYTLSALAALIYIVATISLARADRTSQRWATIAISIELVGVIGVGVLSLIDPELFPKATVWSGFGSGYGFIPLILPIVGLWWLRKTRITDESSTT